MTTRIEPNDLLGRYLGRGWRCVPVHVPDPDTGGCSCGRSDCSNPGKHPDARCWPGGSADPAHFAGRNLGVCLGPDSGNLADVDLDCGEAIAAGPSILPATDAAFGRGGQTTHLLYTITDATASFAKLQDPVLSGKHATIIELRWPEWDEDEGRLKNVQTVFPPSLHYSGEKLQWLRDGVPAAVTGAELAAAVRHVAAAVLIARYARPMERHTLVLLLANLLVRAGWTEDAKVVGFMTAVFAARNDTDKVTKISAGEGLGAVNDARKRLKSGKPMTGLTALKKMLAPALNAAADKVIGQIKEWLDLPDLPGPKVTLGYTPLPPWKPFPVEHLPAGVREFVLTVSRAMRCDPTFVALPALAVCAGMIGATRQIRLKQSWLEPAMIWGAVVGDSGTLKSPPYKRAIAPVLALQATQIKDHRTATETYRAELREYEKAKRKANDDTGDPPTEPVCTRIYSRDTTIEALAGILTNNRTRFLIGRDELSGWLTSFNQYKGKGGSDQANWLELHSLGTLCVDRKTGEPKNIFVRGVGVSICGSIQPGVLRLALSPQHFSAGVPARLLFAYPPRRPKEWTEDDIDEKVEVKYQRLVKGLADLEPHTDEDGDPIPVTLGMTAEAKTEWVAFYERFAHKQAETDGDLAAAFSKLEGYAARLALLHHVCESADAGSGPLEPVAVSEALEPVAVSEAPEPVAVGSVRAGIALAEWFAYEAQRVYQMLAEETEEEQTRKLVEVVIRLAERHGGRVTVTQLQRSNQRRYRSAESAEAALESLVGQGLGRWEPGETTERGGRPSRFFVPRVTCDETDETPEPDDTDGGDETPSGVTEPPGPDSDPSAATPSGESGTGETPAGEPEVSSVSSHVTHVPRAPEPPSSDGGGSVTPGAGVTSHAPSTLVTDSSGVAAAVEVLRGWTGPVGLDTETTGLSPTEDRVRLLQVATGTQGVFVIDLFALPDPRAGLAELFEVLAAHTITGHNLLFDLAFLMRLGFTPGAVGDTMLASQIIHAGDRDVRHTLKDVAARTLGLALDKEHQKADWSAALAPGMLAYAARDAEVPLRAWDTLADELASAGLSGVSADEMDALPCVAWAALHGVGFDRSAWEVLATEVEDERKRLAAELAAQNPGTPATPRNWNSPKQVKEAFAALGVTLKSTKDDDLAAVGHPLAELLRQYRAASKRACTYGGQWLRHVAPDGRVYANWKQLGAGASGRMSCTEPNLQQLPRDPRYRRCFVAPAGRVLVKADYSQIELRIAAKMANDPRMLNAYRGGEDLHTLTASAVLNKPVGEVTKADRQLAKAINFGLLYGMGAKQLVVYARTNYRVTLSEVEADTHRNTFFKTYPGLKRWHRSIPDRPTATRTLAGRRRLAVTRFTEKLNTPVQGTAADGLKRALGLLSQRRAACPGAVPVLFVHDEIVVECDEQQAAEASAWLRQVMVDGMAPLIDPVPVVVEVTTGRTWAGA